MKITTHRIAWLTGLAASMALLLAACGGSNDRGPPEVAPTLSQQPANQTIDVGQTASFSVTAAGAAPLTYQWRKNGTAISGATASSFTTPAAVSSDNGALFTVVVSNGAGSLTSSAATLTVVPADFTLAATSALATVVATNTAQYTLNLGPTHGFNSAVTLSVSGLPAGATASFGTNPVPGGSGSAALGVKTAFGTPVANASLTVTATGGGVTHSLPLTLNVTALAQAIRSVFVIVMENTNWTSVKGNANAPYINNTLLLTGAHAEQYFNAPAIHPSLPNYLWMEAGTNFGIANDNAPAANHQATTAHLVTQLVAANVSWRAYQEDIPGTDCPLSDIGVLYAAKHNPFVYFDDVTNALSSASANCISHVRPFTELATDLTNGTMANYNFITPNLCHDGHDCPLVTADTWLATFVPSILNSATFRQGGALFITWDEGEFNSDGPIGMIVLSPAVRSAAYQNSIRYTHGSYLRSVQEIFHLTPLLGDAAAQANLSDLFATFP